jgi:phage/plasmid-associated DNA primase
MDFNRKIIKKIKAIDLYSKYVEWCSANGERNIISNTKFGLSVKLVYEKKRLNDGVYYTLSPE